MNKIFNTNPQKYKRKKLRNNLTEAEVILWSRLKNRQVLNQHFRRQVSIGRYVVDFYCAKLKLAIEIDGDLHYLEERTIEYDKKRQREIEMLRIKFLRFDNLEVYKNLNGVINEIWITIEGLL